MVVAGGGYWCTGVVLVCILGLCTRGCALGLCTRGVYNGGGLCTGDVHIGAVCQGCALGGYWCVYWGAVYWSVCQGCVLVCVLGLCTRGAVY